jgi:RNA polymerase sigma factor (sigma-70 family)
MPRSNRVEDNLGLIPGVAKRYLGRGLDYDDLFQEGCLGLIKAKEKFDSRRGSFSNCARWYIRQAMVRAIADKGRTIRLPNHAANFEGRIHRISARLIQEGKKVDDRRIAAELEKEIDEMQKKLPKIHGFVLPSGPIHLARAVCRRAERAVVKLTANPHTLTAIKYLNRLSDYLFVLARTEAR